MSRPSAGRVLSAHQPDGGQAGDRDRPAQHQQDHDGARGTRSPPLARQGPERVEVTGLRDDVPCASADLLVLAPHRLGLKARVGAVLRDLNGNGLLTGPELSYPVRMFGS
jgi:hypothetical protein